MLAERNKLRYGKNPSDEVKLKWAIRSQAPKINMTKIMEKVQRLNGFGSERFSQPQ